MNRDGLELDIALKRLLGAYRRFVEKPRTYDLATSVLDGDFDAVALRLSQPSFRRQLIHLKDRLPSNQLLRPLGVVQHHFESCSHRGGLKIMRELHESLETSLLPSEIVPLQQFVPSCDSLVRILLLSHTSYLFKLARLEKKPRAKRSIDSSVHLAQLAILGVQLVTASLFKPLNESLQSSVAGCCCLHLVEISLLSCCQVESDVVPSLDETPDIASLIHKEKE